MAFEAAAHGHLMITVGYFFLDAGFSAVAVCILLLFWPLLSLSAMLREVWWMVAILVRNWVLLGISVVFLSSWSSVEIHQMLYKMWLLADLAALCFPFSLSDQFLVSNLLPASEVLYHYSREEEQSVLLKWKMYSKLLGHLTDMGMSGKGSPAFFFFLPEML